MPDDEKDNSVLEGENDKEFGLDQRRMSFLDHLLELRWRLLVCIATIIVATIVFLFFMRGIIFDWLTLPVKAACEATKGKVKYEDILFVPTPTSLFMASIYYCLFAAIGVTIPVTVWQLWAFVAPGLKRKERGVIGPAILVAFGLFVAGAAFGYFVLIPIMLNFFLSDTMMMGVRPIWDVAETVKLEAIMMLVLGATFELPLVIVALSKLGIMSPKFLAKHRKHAVLVIFIIAAVVTPTGDPLTMTVMAAPLLVLYELGVQAAKFFRPKHGWRDDVPDEPADEPPPDPPSPAPVEPSNAQDHYAGGGPYSEASGHAPSGEGGVPASAEEGWTPPPAQEPVAQSQEPTAPPEAEAAHPPQKPSEPEPPPPEDELPPDAMMH